MMNMMMDDLIVLSVSLNTEQALIEYLKETCRGELGFKHSPDRIT